MIARLLVGMAALMLLASLSACTVDKDFTFTIQKDFPVNQSQNSSFAGSDTVNINSISSDFKSYKGDIKSVTVQSAGYFLSYWNGPSSQQITSATVTVGTPGASQVVFASISNVNCISIAAVEQGLTVTPAGNQKLSDAIKNDPNIVQMGFSGTVNQVPINFVARVKAYISVTYSKKLL